MDHQVHENAARFGFIEKPIARWFLRSITTTMQTDEAGFADLSFSDSRMSQNIFWKESHHVGDKKLDASLVTDIDHFLRLLRGACQGFFTHNLFASYGGFQYHLMMQMSGRADIHHIHVRKHGVEIGKNLCVILFS